MVHTHSSVPRFRNCLSLVIASLILLAGFSFVTAAALGQSNAPAKGAGNANQTVLNETDAYRLSPIVVKFGAVLGMRPETAANVFTLFNILILVSGVGYGLMKTLPNAFRKRNTAIQKHLVDARTATEEATARLSSVEERLSKLDDQIAAIRMQAESDNRQNEVRIKNGIEEEKRRIIEAAEDEIHSATAIARRDIQRYAANLAVDSAASKLNIAPEVDRILVRDFAQRLGEGSNN
ncbi:MAG: ATP synthase F0 subunit B [Acidobacteria bacterium]|nr:ATP synthase F0 subunit B [Acidobacteriota bacterium]